MKLKKAYDIIFSIEIELLAICIVAAVLFGTAVNIKSIPMFIGSAVIVVLFMMMLGRDYLQRRSVAAVNKSYEELLANIRGGLVITTYIAGSDEIYLVYASNGFKEITGYSMEDINNIFDGKCLPTIHENDRQRMLNEFVVQSKKSGEYSIEYRVIRRNGEIIWVLDRGRIVEGKRGVPQSQSVLTDITEIKGQQERLRVNEERFRLTFQGTDNAIFEYDIAKKQFVDFINSDKLMGRTCNQINQELTDIKTVSNERAIQITTCYFYCNEDSDTVLLATHKSLNEGRATFVARVKTSDGGFVWCKVHMTVMRDVDGKLCRVLGFINNIDTIKRQAEVFRQRSEKDALTGFYNKAATVNIINDALAKNCHIPHVMFVLDIDNFKTINDTMGHMAGDAVIAEAAERIRSIFRSDDILGRVGGDEFVVLVGGLADSDHISRKAKEIINSFHTMSVNAGGMFNVSVSIGIDMPSQLPVGYEEIFVRADKALYEAKSKGKNCFVFYNDSLVKNESYILKEAKGKEVI